MSSLLAQVRQRYGGKSRQWWLRTPVYARNLARFYLRLAISRVIYSHPAIWRAAGRPVPAPPQIKRGIVRGYAVKHGLPVFVETGTWHGDTTAALAPVMTRLYSIELSEPLYLAAKERFKDDARVTLLHGDSGQILPQLVRELSEPCLFWLDGHFSGGDTVRGATETPIESELQTVLERAAQDPQGVGRSVILIDDARDFGRGDYPPIAKLRATVKARFPNAEFSVETDIIRIELA